MEKPTAQEWLIGSVLALFVLTVVEWWTEPGSWTFLDGLFKG